MIKHDRNKYGIQYSGFSSVKTKVMTNKGEWSRSSRRVWLCGEERKRRQAY